MGNFTRLYTPRVAEDGKQRAPTVVRRRSVDAGTLCTVAGDVAKQIKDAGRQAHEREASKQSQSDLSAPRAEREKL
jgi:hypothetical protein